MVSKVEIAEVADDDASLEDFLAASRGLDPNLHDFFPPDLRRWDAMTGQHLRVIALDEPDVVGVAGVYGAPNDPASRRLPCNILVKPTSFGLGLGDTLLEHLVTWALERHADAIMSVGVPEREEAVLQFWLDRGFIVVERHYEMVLYVSRTVDGHRPDDSLAIVTLEERPDLLHAMWKLQRDVWTDMPGQDSVMPPIERWRESFESGRLPADGAFLALDETGGPTGMITTGVDPDAATSRAWTSFAGVLPHARGRGIATALKARQIRWCRARGVSQLTANNHEGNEPMRAINRRFGFREGDVTSVLDGAAATLGVSKD